MTSEQLFPTRWILRGVYRAEFAAHINRIRRTIGNERARRIIYHAVYVGCLESKWHAQNRPGEDITPPRGV